MGVGNFEKYKVAGLGHRWRMWHGCGLSTMAFFDGSKRPEAGQPLQIDVMK